MARRVFTRQWLLLGGALLILGSALALNLYQDHQRIEDQEHERLAALANTVAKNIVPQVVLADRIITNVLNALPAWQAQNDGLQRANREIKIINDTINGIPPLLVMDASGTVIISSNPKLLGLNFAHREYFKTAKKNHDPRILQVSAPFKTVLDDFAFTLLRTILGPDGQFAGIVVVTEVPAYFANLLDSVRYAPDVRTWIAHGDGVLFLSLPHIDNIEGRDLAGSETFFVRHRQSGQMATVFTGISFTGGNRMTAQQTLQLLDNPIMDKPLVIGVSRNMEGIYASWYRDALVRGELFVVVLLVTTVGLLLYQRKQHIYDRLMEAQEDERKKVEVDLKESEQRWRFALEGAGDGVWDRNIETGKVAFSRRWKEMLGYRDEEIGDSFEQWKKLVHPDDLALALATLEAYQNGTNPNYVLEHRLLCKDGSWKWILSRGMIVDRKADGSPLRMIGTHSDITERKQAEEQIEELAFYDHLTGLPNRRLLADRMNQILAARVRSKREGALLFIDLDNFKAVNE